MRPLRIVVVFALTLLLSQTVVAVHDIHCLGEEHEQSCEVFFTQDHGADKASVQVQPETELYDVQPPVYKSAISSTLFSSHYLPRAPPF